MENSTVRIKLSTNNMSTSDKSPNMGDQLIAKEVTAKNMQSGKCYVMITEDETILIRKLEVEGETLLFYSPNPQHESGNFCIHSNALDSIFSRILEVASYERWI